MATKRNIQIATLYGNETVPATVFGQYAIHPVLYDDGSFSSTRVVVTHIGTGAAFALFMSQEDARKFVRGLALIDIDEIVRALRGGQELDQATRDYLNDLYKQCGARRLGTPSLFSVGGAS
jgi:hypothetical protein